VVCLLSRTRVISPDDCKTIKGKVSAIYSNGLTEVIIRLSGEKARFVLQKNNNGDLEEFRKQVEGREVQVRYAVTPNPLEPAGSIAQVAELAVGPEVLYAQP